MKKFLHLKVVVLILFLMASVVIKAQVRRDITQFPFNSSQRALLAELIIEFTTVEVLDLHCGYSSHMGLAPNQYDIHDNYNFLPFHRAYLEKLEDWLISQGHPEFVPLPKWTGFVAPPIEFIVAGPNFDGVSPACGQALCSEIQDNPSPIGCGSPTGWTNPIPVPEYLKLNPQEGPSLCDLPNIPYFYTNNPDTSGSAGLTEMIRAPWHNQGHQDLGGVMFNLKSPSAAIFWLWHAAVDDKWKEWEQYCTNQTTNTTPSVDLYMKDNDYIIEHYRDGGKEPNTDEGPMWVSNDIWVRNSNDGVVNQTHQNPEYGQTNYIYVRVRNRGYQTSLGSEQLKLYWAKANTALTWPNHWDGSMTVGSGVSLGELVASQNIPLTGAQDQSILEFEWTPPNPNDYDMLIDEIHHFCLLARIEAINDPMATAESESVYTNTKNNNNIVWKNISVVDLQSNKVPPTPTGEIAGATIFIGNISNTAEEFDIKFQLPRHYKGNSVLEEAEVTVLLDEITWQKWNDNGNLQENLKIFRPDRRQILIEDNNAVLKNLRFEPNEQTLIKMSFNFLTQQMSGQKEFDFDVIQTVSATNEIIGGERYHIIVDGKEGFYADAGNDKLISHGETVDLMAFEVDDDAVYNWYDQEGNLIYTGIDITVSPEITQKYKLEIISELDGIKDYDEIEVKVKEFEILSLSPNPAPNHVVINYKTINANSAYITLTRAYGTTSNYILDVSQENIEIDLTGYASGVYYAILVCNGVAVDTKTLVIE